MMARPNSFAFAEGIVIVALTRGLHATLDKADWPLVKDIKWSVNNSGYASGRDKRTGKTVFMHHIICPPLPGELTDHIDGDKRNNRRGNLRSVTRSVNIARQPHNCRNTSGRKGVAWDKSRNKWTVVMKINGKSTTVGRCDSFDDAVSLRQSMELKLYGEIPKLAPIRQRMLGEGK